MIFAVLDPSPLTVYKLQFFYIYNIYVSNSMIAAVSGLSAACSMLAVRQQRTPCHQFVDESAGQRGRHMTKHSVADRARMSETGVNKFEMYVAIR